MTPFTWTDHYSHTDPSTHVARNYFYEQNSTLVDSVGAASVNPMHPHRCPTDARMHPESGAHQYLTMLQPRESSGTGGAPTKSTCRRLGKLKKLKVIQRDRTQGVMATHEGRNDYFMTALDTFRFKLNHTLSPMIPGCSQVPPRGSHPSQSPSPLMQPGTPRCDRDLRRDYISPDAAGYAAEALMAALG